VPILCEPATSSGRLLYTIGGDVRAVDSLTEAARMLDRDPNEFLVVIGPRAPTNEALAFAASLRMSRPAVGVVLTRHEVDVALLTRALQSGGAGGRPGG
jgi:pilus assembly protein CpaE